MRRHRSYRIAGTYAALNAATACLSLTGCVSGRSATVITSTHCVIDSAGVQFELARPLKRHANSASVRIDLVEAWTPEPPWTSIRLADGRLARLTVSLLSEDGRVFTSAILGVAGGLDARFVPDVPKNASIRNVTIKSDVPLNCRGVVWYDFDSL